MKNCKGMSECAIYADLGRQQEIWAAQEIEEIELDLLKDELFDTMFVDLVERIQIAAADHDRPPVARRRLNQIWTELSVLVNEAAEYRVRARTVDSEKEQDAPG